MLPNSTQVVAQLDKVITFCTYALGNEPHLLLESRARELIALVSHALDVYAPASTSFQCHAQAVLRSPNPEFYKAEMLVGILRGLRTAYVHDLLSSVSEAIRADLFDDFLDMATHLLTQGHKDPAAVYVGAVLEAHLRKLCHKHSVSLALSTPNDDTPKNAGRLNDDLAKAAIYSKLDHKAVTAWLDLRNNAAHGKFDQYDARHVEDLISGVRHFLARYPA